MSLDIATRHYFQPLVYAILLQTIVFSLGPRLGLKRANASWMRDAGTLLPAVPFLVVTIFLHFNFKCWMPLVHSNSFDSWLRETDLFVSPIVRACFATRLWLVEHVLYPLGLSENQVNQGYHNLFVGMFFVSFTLHALFDTVAGKRRVVAGACLILLLGGVAYWAVPAVGPFLFEQGISSRATTWQHLMLERFNWVVTHHALPEGYFILPLAAMPSLHTAHSLFFTYCAARRLRWLLPLYVPVFLWILIEAIATRWHYVIDIGGGVLVAAVCIALVERVIPEQKTGLLRASTP